MRGLAAAFFLLVLVSPGLCAKDPSKTAAADEVLQDVLTMKVDGVVTLDAAGALLEFRTGTPMPDKLRENLDKVVGRWRFMPVLVDGVARQTSTRMRITLIAIQDGENYRVKVDNVIFPGDPETRAAGEPVVPKDIITGKKMMKPEFPADLARQGINGTVLLGVRVDTDGRVVDVVAVQSSLRDVKGKPRVLAQAMSLFEKSAITGAKRWRFNVPASLANASAKDLTVTVPVNYNAFSFVADKPGMWRPEVRGARRPMAWLGGESGLQRIGVSDVNNGEAIPVASAIRLETDVTGTAVM